MCEQLGTCEQRAWVSSRPAQREQEQRRRAAHTRSMCADLAVRQMQYVLYHGRTVAKPSAHGWLKSVSDERAANLAMQPRAPPRAIASGGPAARPGAQHAEHSTVAGDVEVNRATLPEGLQLVITDSPAEFCLPQPRCRAFKPHFQAKARPRHAPDAVPPPRSAARRVWPCRCASRARRGRRCTCRSA